MGVSFFRHFAELFSLSPRPGCRTWPNRNWCVAFGLEQTLDSGVSLAGAGIPHLAVLHPVCRLSSLKWWAFCLFFR